MSIWDQIVSVIKDFFGLPGALMALGAIILLFCLLDIQINGLKVRPKVVFTTKSPADAWRQIAGMVLGVVLIALGAYLYSAVHVGAIVTFSDYELTLEGACKVEHKEALCGFQIKSLAGGEFSISKETKIFGDNNVEYALSRVLMGGDERKIDLQKEEEEEVYVTLFLEEKIAHKIELMFTGLAEEVGSVKNLILTCHSAGASGKDYRINAEYLHGGGIKILVKP